jgi:hypothetical protein
MEWGGTMMQTSMVESGNSMSNAANKMPSHDVRIEEV